MIERISLRDFKVFADAELTFKNGTTAIVGPNGAGKTTVLEAIEFALFRHVTRKEKKIPKVEELIRHGQKKAELELDFLAPINRRVYRVKRIIFPGETKADLFCEDGKEPIASGPTNVDDAISSVLGMDRYAFSALTYVRQGEIDRLSRMTPKSRKSDLSSMMGLSVYEKIIDTTPKGEPRQRVQVFKGMVLARKHGSEPGASITVRKQSGDVNVEKIFPIYSPLVERIVIEKRFRVRRGKLYFLRKSKKRLKEIRD